MFGRRLPTLEIAPVLAALLCLFLPLTMVFDFSFLAPVQKFSSLEIFLYLPFLAFFSTALLGSILHLKRILLASFVLALHLAFLEIPRSFSKNWILEDSVKGGVFVLSVLASLTFTSIIPQLKAKFRSFLLKFVAASGTLVVFSLLNRYRPELVKLVTQLQFIPYLDFANIPEVSVPLVILLGIRVFTFVDRYLRSFFYFILVGLLSVFSVIELKGFAISEIRIAFTCIGFLLVYGMIRIYWQKIYLDELTGIPNRRALNEALALMGNRYTIAMVDVDHFKKFNDSYGHDEGDNVLRMVGKHLAVESRNRAYRYGGEEFTLLFEGYEPEDVKPELEKIREKLAQKEFTIRTKKKPRSPKNRGSASGSKKVHVTISIGVASDADAPRSLEEVFKAADEALYKAKEKGRNCVVLA